MLSKLRKELATLRRLLPSEVVQNESDHLTMISERMEDEDAAKDAERNADEIKIQALATIYGAIDYIKLLELVLDTSGQKS